MKWYNLVPSASEKRLAMAIFLKSQHFCTSPAWSQYPLTFSESLPGAVRHHALALRAADPGAEVGFGRATEDAVRLIALRGVARHNVITRLQTSHALAH
jgi:hypothetical protein